MYLSGFPKYFTKDGERRAVYYTVDARDLLATGWKQEVAAKEKIEKPVTVEVVAIDEQPNEPESPEPDFEAMTKAELLSYALKRGLDLPNNAPKAQLIEACKDLK